ncbi:seipin isoform X1 [Schistocerca serialis cubense]|uniref:seipin n=1 Tax=Schistocerca cancellata TaxID=274614 RepID=UPI0021174C83|nr:seipin [Schistocerca cancellata]XP_049961283.1 seipin isoform X1 [Schistocerca serialis cubense]
MGLSSIILAPFRWYRRNVVDKILEAIYSRLRNKIDNTSEVVLKAGVGAAVLSVIIWTSVFLYVAFYYTYMPSISHTRPVHFQFDSCVEKRGICSYPSAKVQLTRKQSLLMVGQQYKMSLNIEMPESPVNKRLGMFMACVHLYDRGAEFISKSCKSGMLHYRSPLLQTLSTVVLSPLLIFGSKEEKQIITLEMFSDLEDDQVHPVTDIFVELQTRHIELYSATLNINARFTGLRYLMYNWPVLSAIIGISSNMFFIMIICVLSWLRVVRSDNMSEFEAELLRRNSSNGSKASSQFTGDISQDDSSLMGDNGKQSESDVVPLESREQSEVSEAESFDLIRTSSVEVIRS